MSRKPNKPPKPNLSNMFNAPDYFKNTEPSPAAFDVMKMADLIKQVVEVLSGFRAQLVATMPEMSNEIVDEIVSELAHKLLGGND